MEKKLPGRFCRRLFRLAVTLRVGESSSSQGGDNSRWLRGSLNSPEPHGRHWIFLPNYLFFLLRGASRFGHRDTWLRQSFEIFVNLRSVRQLRVRMLPLQNYSSRRCASVNILAKTFVRFRNYVRLRATDVRWMPV